jgi:hypothetical protein
MKNKIVKLSLVTSMLLGSGAYAGEIIGAAPNDPVEPLTQFGFGSWNLSNVDVKIVSVEDFMTVTGTFNKTTGEYSEMTYGDSFESAITTGGEVRGHLHGKDWPVGEPAGIKAITGDIPNKGKPGNCILTTSYLSEENTDSGLNGYLDTTAAAGPVPVICSSPFQTHKRFKINMLPTMVANPDAERYGQPVEVIFNLKSGDTTSKRYQVLQKINNYTGMRLDGYKVEVLTGNDQKISELTLSIGLAEATDNNGTPDAENPNIWDPEDLANYSHGLWGPIDQHFPVNGFFDDKRSGYVVDETGHGTDTLVAGPTTLAGNYVDLFGHWLPSIWQPIGVFFDDDGDPETDAELIAFWGDPLNTGTNAWHQGNEDNWAVVTQAQIDEYLADESLSGYNVGLIEDTLNLGLNYIINIGDNTKIGDTFKLRITPRVAVDQTPPSYIDENGDYILPEGILPDEDDNDTIVPDVDDNDTHIDNPPSSGGGCTYDPKGGSFDMMFLMMIALGSLYAFRRRFLK